VLLGPLFAVAGCRPSPRVVSFCTLGGGVPVLRVAVAGIGAADTVRVRAVAQGAAPRPEGAVYDTASAVCAGPACATGVFLQGFAPDTVRLTLAARGATVARVAVPAYDTVYPNGRGCPPATRVGRVEVEAP
jgi:hypothetical protein